MNSLPRQLFNDIVSPRNAVINRAWGSVLTLVTLVLILNIVARAITRRSRMA
jgi:ABC-type phosphate transport system permease subunit